MKRTHTCGELTAKNIGEKASLMGWVHKRRDHGKIIFIDIRDRHGITQIVFFKNKKAEELRSEYVIGVKGVVQKRPKGTENPKIITGEVELAAEELEIINDSLTPPFELDQMTDISEEVRLKYRYIDLRRHEMQKNIFLRHRFCKATRDFLDREGFIEVETPILTKSTPEGARDFLVPSRLNRGSFYALPQSPQLFKQLLMVSGFERYFQIAKCFRDEDLRSDRQPEFTQLDMEMSFIDEEDIFDVIERSLYHVFKEVLGKGLKIPFQRMTYQEAMDKYKSDKPDIKEAGEDFAFLWVLNFPLFKFNEEEKRWDMEHHPFTSPVQDDIDLIESSPEKVRSRAYDLVVNGIEIASGSIRIHRRELQEKIFRRIGLDAACAKERFGFLLDAFSYGAPPHGGIALGLDRLLALICGVESIREVIAFPKTQKASCPLTDAPSHVDDKQLKELGIKVEKDKPKKGGDMERLLCCSLLIAALALSGCAMRLIPKEMDRVDQEMTGNRGIITGRSQDMPKPKGDRRETRTVYDLEIEFSSPEDVERAKKERPAQEMPGNKGYLQRKTVPESRLRPVEEKKTGSVLLRPSEPSVIYKKMAEPQDKYKKEKGEGGLVAAKEAKAKTYVVQKGDTLQKISEKIYGTTKKWKGIYEANKNILKSPDNIRPGQELAIP